MSVGHEHHIHRYLKLTCLSAPPFCKKKKPTKTCWFYVYISLFFHAPRYLTPEVGLRPGQSYRPLLRINFCLCTRKNPGWFGKLFSITRVTTTLFIKSLLVSVVVDSNIRRFKPRDRRCARRYSSSPTLPKHYFLFLQGVELSSVMCGPSAPKVWY